ncbi:MAG: diguanylate cyclase [Ruminococcaceae bacterium]|nr:diguanylate cyclase [Oscillospiraceae bacterium]
MEAMERAMLYAIPNFAGIAILIIMIISRRDTSLKTSEKVYFDSTLYSIAVLLFVSSMLWFCECSAAPFVVFINRIMSFAYSSVLPIIGMFYVFYCECRMSDEHEVPRAKKVIFILPVVINAVVSLLSVFSGTYFDIVNGKYVRGPLFSIPFVVMFAYLVYASVTTFSTSKKQVNLTKKPEFLYLSSFSILPVLGGLVQIFFYGAEIMAIALVISSLIVYNDSQNRLISIDPLTITNNKWQLNRYLERVGKSLSPQMMLFVMFVDIDSYRSIVRSYGREAGNEAVVEAATRLKKIVSGSHDFLCRIGTDRFVIVAQRPSEAAADITRTTYSKKFEELGKQDFKAYDLTVSIGLAGAETIENMEDVDLLINEAEKDMRKIRKVSKRFSKISKSSLYGGEYYKE